MSSLHLGASGGTEQNQTTLHRTVSTATTLEVDTLVAQSLQDPHKCIATMGAGSSYNAGSPPASTRQSLLTFPDVCDGPREA